MRAFIHVPRMAQVDISTIVNPWLALFITLFAVIVVPWLIHVDRRRTRETETLGSLMGQVGSNAFTKWEDMERSNRIQTLLMQLPTGRFPLVSLRDRYSSTSRQRHRIEVTWSCTQEDHGVKASSLGHSLPRDYGTRVTSSRRDARWDLDSCKPPGGRTSRQTMKEEVAEAQRRASAWWQFLAIRP